MGKNSESFDDDPRMSIILSLDDGSEVECLVLEIFTVGEREYVALLPTEGKDAKQGKVYLYRFNETQEGEPDLTNIESDEEFDLVSDEFDRIFDEADEYDELVDDEE